MVRIQQSIEISVPVHVAYNRLTQFEDFPRFMQDVATVRRLDDTHLHWTTTMSTRNVEWDAAITEQIPERCVAWHSTSGPMNAGKLEVVPAGPQASRVTLMLESEPEQVPGSSTGNSESEMAHRLEQDLTRMKEFLEAEGAPVPTSSFAAGSEGWDGTEDPEAPVISAAHHAAIQSDQVPSGFKSTSTPPSPSDATARSPEAGRTTQSPHSLSQSSDNEEQRFSIAEEVNLDQQSDSVRNVGQMPPDIEAAGPAAMEPSDAMAKSMRQDEKQNLTKLKKALDKAIPPSEEND
jgi:hypothetical protein